jgi:methyl-accepting chemotaxis protein
MMRKNLTLGRKLGVGFTVMTAVTAALAVVSLAAIRAVGREFEAATMFDARQLDVAHSMAVSAAEMLSEERGILVRAYARDWQAAAQRHSGAREQSAKVAAALTQLGMLISGGQSQVDLDSIQNVLAVWDPAAEEIYSLARVNPQAAEKKFEGSLPLIQDMQDLVEDLCRIQRTRLDARVESARTRIAEMTWMTGAFAFVFALVGGVVLWVVRSSARDLKEIASEIGDSTAHVSLAASQMSASSQMLAQGASEQAASLEQTSASTEEITSMTGRNAENSRTAATVMTDVDRHVKNGNRTLEQMLVSMNEITASSDKISKIIKVIDEIAFQTNILALNAAVEAARAGEAGMGFAVVSDEVRNLAQRSAQAAKDTASLIEESIAKSNEGGLRLKQVAEVMTAITASASQVKTLVDEVNLGSEEQARGIQEISKAVQLMSQVTQNTAASAEQSAAAGKDLSVQAESMNRMAIRLRKLASGAAPLQAELQPEPQPVAAGRRSAGGAPAHASRAGWKRAGDDEFREM